jgi:large subunit ribosomal protein L5
MEENPMREIRIEKVTLNIGCGGDLQKIERGKKLLELLSGEKPTVTKSKRRSTFGIAKGKPVGVKVTLRKKDAEEFFKKVLLAVDKKIKMSQFDKDGNLNIGIKEYIDLPNVKYQPSIGILGFDVAVTFERPGYRVKRRKVKKGKISKEHKINKEDVIKFLEEKFGVVVE